MSKKNRSARQIFFSALVFILSLANFLPTFKEQVIYRIIKTLKYNICVKLSFRQEAQESNLKEIDLKNNVTYHSRQDHH